MNTWEFLYLVGMGVAFLTAMSISIQICKERERDLDKWFLSITIASLIVSFLSWAVPIVCLYGKIHDFTTRQKKPDNCSEKTESSIYAQEIEDMKSKIKQYEELNASILETDRALVKRAMKIKELFILLDNEKEVLFSSKFSKEKYQKLKDDILNGEK